MSLVEGGLKRDDIGFLRFNWRRSPPSIDAEVLGNPSDLFGVVNKGDDFHL